MEYSNENQLNDLFDVKIDAKAQEHLRVAVIWARIVAILAFVSIGFTFVELIIGAAVNPVVLITGIFWLLIFGGLTVVIYMFLYKFANNMKAGIDGMNQELFNIAIGNLKTHFKILGIILIVVVSLALIIILGSLFLGIMATSMN